MTMLDPIFVTTPKSTSSGVPDRIQFRLIESDDFLDRFAVRHEWTPFEAACLVFGMEPGQIVDGTAVVGVTSNFALDQESVDKFETTDHDTAASVLNLTESIQQRWSGATPTGQAIIEWAVNKGLIGNTPFVHQVLGIVPNAEHLDEIGRLHDRIEELETQLAKQSNNQGKHHQEKRLAVLGAAIKELALNLGDQPDKIAGLVRGDTVSATALANHLHLHRREIGVPSEDTVGFAYSGLEDTIRSALKAANSFSTDKD